MSVAILKYNAGNVRSVAIALDRLGAEHVITDDHDDIRNASHVIMPGVGEASTAMSYLSERGLPEVVSGLRQPVLGICLGLQLLCSHTEENDTKCIGVFPESVRLFRQASIRPSPTRSPRSFARQVEENASTPPTKHRMGKSASQPSPTSTPT